MFVFKFSLRPVWRGLAFDEFLNLLKRSLKELYPRYRCESDMTSIHIASELQLNLFLKDIPPKRLVTFYITQSGHAYVYNQKKTKISGMFRFTNKHFRFFKIRYERIAFKMLFFAQ